MDAKEKAMQTNARRHVDLFRNGLIPETEPRRTIHFERLRNGPETGLAEQVSCTTASRYIRVRGQKSAAMAAAVTAQQAAVVAHK